MRRLVLAVTLIATTVASTVGQEKRLITETDIMKFVWIAEGQISPDGKQVAFTRVVINENKDDYETSLWLVPADGSAAPRVLTSGTRASFRPSWVESPPVQVPLRFVKWIWASEAGSSPKSRSTAALSREPHARSMACPRT